jgi:DNA mismatch repair protein MutL
MNPILIPKAAQKINLNWDFLTRMNNALESNALLPKSANRPEQEIRRPVRELPAEIARKIAAGEVIDRPAAIVRELLDNAVDAGAKNISVEIEGGGIEKIRVLDDGSGMTKDDIEHCARPHATSKISQEIDLLNISTLGFRGEALASIAAVSRLSIMSARDGEAWKLRAGLAQKNIVEAANLHTGTIVVSESLFEDVPARRHFLKRPASEGAACRQTFIEKASPRTDIAFRYTQDGALKLDLPLGQTPQERFTQSIQAGIEPRLLFEVSASDTLEGKWKFSLVIGEPSVFRSDRKYIYIYVNGRKISEYALLQAIEYGAEGFFPNGTHPCAVLFLDIVPSLVDFNIHPAKKEARFKDISPIHHALSGAVRQFFHHSAVKSVRDQKPREAFNFIDAEGFLKNDNSRRPAQNVYEHSGRGASFFDAQSFAGESAKKHHEFIRDSFLQKRDSAAAEPWRAAPRGDFRYAGSAFGVFIIIEKDDALYFIDHHAAHEKILYDQFIAARGQKQPLLVPYVLETESADQDRYLESIKEAMSDAGFDVECRAEGRWEIFSVPVLWQGGEEDLRQDILEKHLEPDEVLSRFAAACACRKAIKEGDFIDSDSACFIAREAFAMENPRCPHGRPLWFELQKKSLYGAVMRT